MKRTAWAQIIIVLSLLFHCAMLANLLAHFSIKDGTIVPIRRNFNLPEHWRASSEPVGPFKTHHPGFFSHRFIEWKERFFDSQLLTFTPPRKTNNFGLDLILRDATNTDPGGDFFQLYEAGIAAKHGMRIYENIPANAPKHLRKLKQAIPFHPLNKYPPMFIFTIGIFLTMFKPWPAYLFWTFVHEVVLAYCVWLTWSFRKDILSFAITFMMWLTFLPWYLELYMGQTTFIIMAGTFVIGCSFLDKKYSGNAAMWWWVTLVTKPLTLLFAPLFWKEKRYKTLFIGVAIPLITSSIYFLRHPEDFGIFSGWAFGQEMVSSLGNAGLQNLVFHFFCSRFIVGLLSVFLVAIGLAVTFHRKTRHPVIVLCFWICVYFLGYAHVWQHHLVLMIPATILPFLVTGKLKYLIPWVLGTIPSPFFLFEGHWNWLRDIVYLIFLTAPPVSLALILLLSSMRGKQEFAVHIRK